MLWTTSIFSHVEVTYKLGFGLDDWIYCTLYIHNSGLRAIQHYRWSTPFTVHCYTGTRILSLTVTSNHTWSLSFHSLIPFLPLFCSCQFWRLNSVQFLCSQAHIPAGWHPETRLFISDYCSCKIWVLFFTWSCLLTVSSYNPLALTTQKMQPLLLRRHVYWSVDVLMLHMYALRECVYQVVA
jgi:hypothetical protein